MSGTFSNVLESTVRNRLFGRRLFFFLFDIHLLRTILLRSIRVEPRSANAVAFRKNMFLWSRVLLAHALLLLITWGFGLVLVWPVTDFAW